MPYSELFVEMNSSSQVSRDELTECIISRRQGSENLQNAVVRYSILSKPSVCIGGQNRFNLD